MAEMIFIADFKIDQVGGLWGYANILIQFEVLVLGVVFGWWESAGKRGFPRVSN